MMSGQKLPSMLPLQAISRHTIDGDDGLHATMIRR